MGTGYCGCLNPKWSFFGHAHRWWVCCWKEVTEVRS
uniref:Uncharacterized protein n=1 Tax=Anguilla anguilla TaxID=7936 RepID=A0A0E9S755_ANGAN